MKDSADFTRFFTRYGEALDSHEAALFIGAGLSVPAGYRGWTDLLRDVAADLQLAINPQTDLVALAQYHVNERKGIRTELNDLLANEYGRRLPLQPNHHLIARLPVETVWTTNYDTLLERAFEEAGKRCDVKATTATLSRSVRGKDVTIYKMHGDAANPDEAILTKEDYELYDLPDKRQMFSNILQGELVNRTFLFLGFSFTDPNIDYVLRRIRILMGRTQRQHFCVMRRPAEPKARGRTRADEEYVARLFELRIADLARYGITPLIIDGYDEITELLERLNRRAHRNNIFVSGSTAMGSTDSEQKVERLAQRVGKEAIRRGYNIVSGFGLGVGNAVLLGAMEEVYSDGESVPPDRIMIRPFPQLARSDPRRTDLFTVHRRDLLSLAGYAVFLGGTKLDPATGQLQPAQGALEEYKIALELGKVLIPVGATGGAARAIWELVMAERQGAAVDSQVKRHLTVLGDETRTEDELIDAVFAIIGRILSK